MIDAVEFARARARAAGRAGVPGRVLSGRRCDGRSRARFALAARHLAGGSRRPATAPSHRPVAARSWPAATARARPSRCRPTAAADAGSHSTVSSSMVAGSLDDQLVVRRHVAHAEQHALDLGRVQVHAANDQHVVVAPAHARHARRCSAADARRGSSDASVAGAVAQHRQRLLGQRGEHQLALFARRQRRAGRRGRSPRPGSGPPGRARRCAPPRTRAETPGPTISDSPYDVQRGQMPSCAFDLVAHRLGPRLGAENAHAAASAGRGRRPAPASVCAMFSAYDGVQHSTCPPGLPAAAPGAGAVRPRSGRRCSPSCSAPM